MSFTFHVVYTITRASVRMWIEIKTVYLKAQTPLTLFFSYHREYNVKVSIFIFVLLWKNFSVVLSSLQQRTSYTEVLLINLLRHCIKLKNLSNMN